MTMARTKKSSKKRVHRLVTRVNLDGWEVLVRMRRLGLDTAGLAARMGRSVATTAALLAKIDERSVQSATAIRVAEALGCEVGEIERGEGRGA